ncbi:MAG: hypothetical protein MJ215_07030, partial [Spirochaetia bacterium]|nr:hypothetical protein [Spirochaetia bacterium]
IVHQIRGDKYKKQTALDNLWKGQGYMTLSCSCARGAKKAYSSFIEAEKLSRTKGIFISGLIKYDFRLSGDCQYLYQGDNYNAYLQRKGASIFEFDRAVPAWNYVPLGDDSCSMGLFADYFTDYADDITFSFADSMFDVVDFQRDDKKVRLSFRRKTADFNVMILKSYQFLNTKIVVDYEVVNMGGEPLSRRFMCNFNFNLFCIADSGEPMITDNNFQILDKGKIVSIFSDAGCTFVHRAVTDEMGEYDSSNVSLFWNIHELKKEKSWINRVEFSCCWNVIFFRNCVILYCNDFKFFIF